MTETFAEYRARVLGYLGTRDPVRVQRATPAALERRLRAPEILAAFAATPAGGGARELRVIVGRSG